MPAAAEWLVVIDACSEHVFSNKGIGGTSSGIFTACAEQMVPPEADLVVGAARLPAWLLLPAGCRLLGPRRCCWSDMSSWLAGQLGPPCPALLPWP